MATWLPLIIAVLTALGSLLAHMWGKPKSLTEIHTVMTEQGGEIRAINATVKELKADFRDSQQRQWDEINCHTGDISIIRGDIRAINERCAERHRANKRRTG